MACKCGKNKDCKCGKSELLYIMNPGCGWCKKADPVVEELVKDGYKITTLDIRNADDSKKAKEVQAKYNVQCGTPLFIDAGTGNMACGFREKDVLEKWAKGEEMPAPPPRKKQGQDDKPTNQIVHAKLEYIWLDGNSPKQMRSKTLFNVMNMTGVRNENDILSKIPTSTFDGSSTNQADAEDSDLIIRPVRIVPNVMERTSENTASYYVLCEVLNPDMTPHESNTRALLEESSEKNKEHGMFFGIEQEYVVFDENTKLPVGWDSYEDNQPEPQGNYYCGVGGCNVKLRDLSTEHAMMCNSMRIPIIGTNAEVMLSQWEYQLQPAPALFAADNLWLSRYVLHKMSEKLNLSISFDPKPITGDWNGSGAHINFSTKETRKNPDPALMNILCSSMEEHHKDAISHYGEGNEKRLTGKHETSSIDEFTWSESDRTVSVRIPLNGLKMGYIEDRRPAANMDPYEACNHLLNTVCEIIEDVLVTT